MIFFDKTKTKLIALLSSIILWFYVTTVVDPSETKTYKDIPITIANSHLLNESSLGVFLEETLTANITVKTNLSKLKKITKDNLVISGSISNPVPGKNILTLTSNLPDSIRTEIEPSNIAINLEVLETVSKDISVIANKKYTSEEYELKIDKETIEVSGTKTLINKIDKVIATVKGNDTEDSFSEKLELIPIDKDGQKVENIKLSDKYITATITKIIAETEEDEMSTNNEDVLENNSILNVNKDENETKNSANK